MSSGRRRLVIGAWVLALIAALLVVHWRISRARARSFADQSHRAAVRLDECVGSRERLRRAFADDRPLAPCAALARELEHAALGLAGAPYRRDAAAARTLAETAAALVRAPWDSTARAWLEPALADTFAAARRARSLAGSLALDEGVPAPAAPPSADPTPPAAQIVVDVELADPIVELDWTTVPSAEGPRLGIVARTAKSRHAWLARADAAGKSWQLRALDLPDVAPDSLPALPHVAPLPGGAVAVAVFTGSRVAVSRRDQPATIHTLPDAHRPIGTGTALLALGDRLAIALIRDATGAARIWDEPFEPTSFRDAPPGRLVAATASSPPRLILARSSKTGFVELAQLDVPAPGAAWPEPKTTTVSYVPELEPAPSPDRSCGLPGESYFTWLARGTKNDVLVASGAAQIFPFRFTSRKKSELDVTCGKCPPQAFERSAEGLRVFPAVRRQLAPATVTTPIGFEPRSLETAVAACTGEQVIVAYIADERVLAQGTSGGGWRFDRPEVIAEPTPLGAPVDVGVIGLDKRTLVLWRRALPRSRRLRIEATEIVSR